MRFFSTRFFALSAALIVAFLLTACFPPTAGDWKQCRFTVGSVEFQGMRERQAEWQVVLIGNNPTSKRLELDSLHLFALMGEDTLATLDNTTPLDLAPESSTNIPLNLRMSQVSLNKALRNFQGGSNGEITVSGDAWVPTWFGVRRIHNAVHTTYRADLGALMNSMGGDLLRNLFFRH